MENAGLGLEIHCQDCWRQQPCLLGALLEVALQDLMTWS